MPCLSQDSLYLKKEIHHILMLSYPPWASKPATLETTNTHFHGEQHDKSIRTFRNRSSNRIALNRWDSHPCLHLTTPTAPRLVTEKERNETHPTHFPGGGGGRPERALHQIHKSWLLPRKSAKKTYWNRIGEQHKGRRFSSQPHLPRPIKPRRQN